MTEDVFVQCSQAACATRFVAPPGTPCPFCHQATRIMAQRYPNVVRQRPVQRVLHVVFDGVRSALNVGVMLRTAEALGVACAYHCGITPAADHPKVAKAALGAQMRVTAEAHRDAVAVVTRLVAQGLHVVALENTAAAADLYDLLESQQLASELVIVVGNEVAGVDPAVLALCHHVVALPMLGDKNSLNVGHAFAAAAFALTHSRA